MIKKIFNSPHVLWQTPDTEVDLPNEAIAGCVDSGGTIVLTQGDNELVVNKATVPDLCKLLKQLAKVKIP